MAISFLGIHHEAAGDKPREKRLARPGSSLGAWRRALLLAPALAAVAVELFRLSPAQWVDEWLGSTAVECLASIPALAVPLLAAALLALRRGAPLSPVRAGAAAGLAAGAIAASLYALHCYEDSPLFYATWYSLAISVVGAAGALLGWRLLRW